MAVRTVAVKLIADIGGYTSGIEKAARSTDKLADGAEKTSKQHKAAWDQIGKGAAVAAGIGVLAVGAMVKSYMDFDATMSQVQAATGATGDELDQLRQSALDAGKATVFSATESAAAQVELAKAGVSTADILGGALTGALDLAAAGQLGVADAAGIAATAMTQFGLAGTDVPHIADLLAAGAGKAQGEVTDLATALKYVGPVAHQMGISIEETTGVLAELASQGILADQAGTSLRGMLSALTSPSAIAAKTMKQLGINVYDAQGNFVGFNGVAGQLQSQLGGLTNAQRDQALGMIFGNEQITAARILYAGGANAVDDWTAKVNDAGFAQEQAAAKLDNLSGDLEALRGSIETTLIQGGSAANSTLRKLTQTATGVVNVFADLPGPLQATAVGLIVVGTAGAGALAFFGSVVPRIRAARVELDGMGKVGATANRVIGLTGRAVGASIPILGLAAAAIQIYNQRKAEGAQRVKDFTSAIQADNGALGENTRQVAVNTLEQAGALKAAQTFGLSLGDVTDAALGNQAALGRVNGVLDAYYAATLEANTAGGAGETVSQDQAKAYHALRDSIGGTNSEVNKAVDAAKRQTEAQGTQKSSTDQAAASARGAAAAFGEQKSAADQLKSSIDALNGVRITAAEADIRYRDSVAAATEAIHDNGHTIDLNTTKGRLNQTAIIASIKAASDHAQAVADQTAAVKGQTAGVAAGNTVFGQHVAQLRKVLTQAGLTKGQIDALISTYARVPKKANTNVGAPGAREAEALAKRVQSAMSKIPSNKNVTIQVTASGVTAVQRQIDSISGRVVGIQVGRVGVGPQARAAGGPVEAGQVYRVNERGQEGFFVPPADGVIVPAHQMNARMLQPAGAASGSTVNVAAGALQLTLTGAPGMSPGQVGQLIDGALTRFAGRVAVEARKGSRA